MDIILKEYLIKNKLIYKLYEHPAVFTVSDSQTIKENIPGLHCKTLFLKDEKGIFYLVGLPAMKRLNSKIFRERMSIKKIRFASAEELKKETTLTPGSVSIYGAIHFKKNNVLVIDSEIMEADEIGFHPNVNTATLVMKHKHLKKFYNSLSCKKKIMDL